MKSSLFGSLLFFILLTNLSLCQMQLKVSSETVQDNLAFSVNNQSYEAPLKLKVNTSSLLPSVDRLRAMRMFLILNFVYALTMGDFNDAWSGAVGGSFTFAYLLASSAIMLTATVGYLSYLNKEDLPQGYDFSFSTIPILIGLRYLFLRNMAAFMPYLSLRLGLHLLKSTQKYSFAGFSDERSDSESKFGFNIGAGFMYLLSTAILLDFTLEYMSISADPDSINHIAFFLGLAYGLGS